ASNPGQFESDSEVLWQRGQMPDSVYHHGRVGINTDRPDEAMVIHGNLKVMGSLVHPSDIRAKENVQEVDTTDNLKRISQMRLVHYQYKPEFAATVGIENTAETVKEGGDVVCANGETIPNLLVVNKELCKLTDNLETRIDELERWSRKLAKLRRLDSMKSTVSGGTISQSGSQFSRTGSGPLKKRPVKSGSKSPSPENSCISHRFLQGTILALVIIMAFSVISMSVLYVLTLHHRGEITETDGSASLCILSMSWTPILTATVIFCPSVCPWSVSGLGSSRKNTYYPRPSTPPPQASAPPSPSLPSRVACCGSTPATSNQSTDIQMPSINQSISDVSSPIPTPGTSNKKAKSRAIEKDSRYRNRIHTSAPSYLTKVKRLPSADQEDMGGQSPTPSLIALRILETDQPILTQYCPSPDSCRMGVYSYTAALHGNTSVPTHVTLQMSSNVSVLVLQCSVTRGRPCRDHIETEQTDEKITFTKGTDHLWSIPVQLFQEITYHFRVAASREISCARDEETGPYSDYHFLFQSSCD
ncbi:hypothetical protein JZ751_021022, partial [Albula glossodonta]